MARMPRSAASTRLRPSPEPSSSSVLFTPARVSSSSSIRSARGIGTHGTERAARASASPRPARRSTVSASVAVPASACQPPRPFRVSTVCNSSAGRTSAARTTPRDQLRNSASSSAAPSTFRLAGMLRGTVGAGMLPPALTRSSTHLITAHSNVHSLTRRRVGRSSPHTPRDEAQPLGARRLREQVS